MRRFATFLLISLGGSPAAAASPAYRIDPEHSVVTAQVGFLGIGSRTARFPKVAGTLSLPGGDAIRLDVRLDATALQASDSVTERRLKGERFFDAAHYPVVIFTGRTMVRTGPHACRIDGTITARGVTRPTMLDVSFSRPMAGSGPMHISATTRIDRRDFGMTAYSFIVGRRVSIAIEADLQPSA